jgi:hypothetical protein
MASQFRFIQDRGHGNKTTGANRIVSPVGVVSMGKAWFASSGHFSSPLICEDFWRISGAFLLVCAILRTCEILDFHSNSHTTPFRLACGAIALLGFCSVDDRPGADSGADRTAEHHRFGASLIGQFAALNFLRFPGAWLAWGLLRDLPQHPEV